MDTTVPVATDAADPSLAAVQQTPEAHGTPDTQQTDASTWEQERATYQTQLQQRESELQQERDARAKTDQALAQQAAKAWRDEEFRVHAAVQQMDPDQGRVKLAQYYQAREQFILNQRHQEMQQVHTERVHAYADYAARELGLDDADKTQLVQVGLRDGNAMAAEAERLHARRTTGNSEVQQLREEIEQLKRGQQANAMRSSGAWQTSSGVPQPVSTEIKPGSADHLKSLLGMAS